MTLKAAFAGLAACAFLASPALAQERPKGAPAASVSIEQVSVAFIGSGALGGGTLTFRGRSYPITVGGLGIGGIGASILKASGAVYGLKNVQDFAGVYAQVRAGWALGDAGRGTLWLTNNNGVTMKLKDAPRGAPARPRRRRRGDRFQIGRSAVAAREASQPPPFLLEQRLVRSSRQHAPRKNLPQDQRDRDRGQRRSRRDRRGQNLDRHRLLRPYAGAARAPFADRYRRVAKGDLHIDQHHTVEDVGIALGQAMRQALGDRAGIARYADALLPMDETLTRVAIDVSGRPFLVFKTVFPRQKIGEFDTELVREFFQAFAMNAGVTLHVETLYGVNAHHISESCFKGLARALRLAVALDARQNGAIPSTKGSLGG